MYEASPSPAAEAPPQCSICLEDITGDLYINTGVCNHSLHQECLVKLTSDVCPVCRSILKIDSQTTDVIRDNKKQLDLENSDNTVFDLIKEINIVDKMKTKLQSRFAERYLREMGVSLPSKKIHINSDQKKNLFSNIIFAVIDTKRDLLFDS